MIIYTPDGVTYRRLAKLPKEHWEQINVKEGTFHELTAGNANSYGYYQVATVDAPASTPTTTYVEEIRPDGAGGWEQMWIARPLTQDELDWAAAMATRDTHNTALNGAIPTLRQWATDAAAVTVTTGNNTAVTQTMVDRLAIFFDRFADLLEERR